MIALARNPGRLESPDAARGLGDGAVLVEQLARSTQVLRSREARGQGTRRPRAVVRSLRETLARMREGGGMPEDRDSDFVIRARGGEAIELWRGGTKLPVESRALREALESGGVVPLSGQALLADPELAREVIEESLVQCSLEEFRLREKKSLLLRNLVDLPAPSAQAS